MRQIILYAGLHKTGSTSLQQTALRNEAWLRRSGVHYPRIAVEGKTDANHTYLLNWMFRARPDRLGSRSQFNAGTYDEAQRTRLRSDVGRAIRNLKGSVLFAAESVSVYRAEELADMRHWFEEQGWALRVICHIRHIPAWLNSMVSQRVTGQMGMTIAQSIDEFVQAGGIVKPRLERLRACFPQAEFYSHEEATRHPFGPPGYFFEKIGLRPDASVQWVRANEGRSGAATRVLSAINERYGLAKWSGSHAEYLAFSNSRPVGELRALPGPKFALSRDEAAPVIDRMQREAEWLATEFGPQFRGAAPAFEAPAAAWTDKGRQVFNAVLARCPPELRQLLLAAHPSPPHH